MEPPDFAKLLGMIEKPKIALDQLASEREAAESDPHSVKKLSDVIRDDAFAVFLLGSLGNTPMAATPLQSYKLYIERFVADTIGNDAGNNPLLRILIEQVVLAHFTSIRLHSDAAGVFDPETRRTNHSLATSLTGEIRRLITQITMMKSQAARSRAVTPSVPSVAKIKVGGQKNKKESKPDIKCA